MSETLEQIVRRVAITRGVLLFDGRSQDLIELVKEVVAELAKGRPPVSAEAIAAGLKFCCGREERLVLEISALRNVVQAAMNDGGKKVFTSWNYNFPDDLRDVPKQRQGSDLRNMISAMQSGEMTVSRGVELFDMWLAGNYSDDMLPPVREGLGEDEMPWDRIDALTKQRDELLALVNGFHRKLETYRNVYSGDKELRRLLSECEAAIAKTKEEPNG